ncbi:hypothetical protein [Corallococcus sp. Z5C101001]|uniref:hypothetical protein n=1 Tax=Corallococcus sp. Z5C101001 TaxID=2596829 RepID=UPI001180F9CA|nr:hypothetical protein [Corallococcus sp. Z5C101001]TSC23962.1 hypothetical protein FOF48_27550 [Corallococcus sp. Z5C101001]
MSTRMQPPAPGREDLSTPSADALAPLFEEAVSATGASRRLMAGQLNALIARLVHTEDPGALAHALHGLLGRQGVGDLVDEQGIPVSIAATRGLLALPHPHPLEVPPERLKAVYQYGFTVTPAPAKGMLFVLGVASLVQFGCFIVAENLRNNSHGLTAAGEAPLAPPPVSTWTEVLARWGSELWLLVRPGFPLVQFVGAVLAFFFATVAADTTRERRMARRIFLGLGIVGIDVALAAPAGDHETWGVLAAGVGALIAGLMLRASPPSRPPVP